MSLDRAQAHYDNLDPDYLEVEPEQPDPDMLRDLQREYEQLKRERELSRMWEEDGL